MYWPAVDPALIPGMASLSRRIRHPHLPSQAVQQTDPAILARALLGWIAHERRDFPWRRRRDPYTVWISEIMLQQTQASTVVPYYERWIQQFPDVSILAAAPLDAVLKAWEGLGYYARARNIHRAAGIIVAQHSGRIPSDMKGLLALPGIGRYTAGAILSLSYGQAAPVLDGNVRRLLARVDDVAEDPTSPSGERLLWDRAGALVQTVPSRSAGDLNEAMMELGATVCTPRRPDCPICPLRDHCVAYALGVQDARPVIAPKPPVPRYDAVAALITHEDGHRHLMVRRPYEGLLGGLWGFPNALVGPERSSREQLPESMRELLGIQVEAGQRLAVIRHAYTHFRIVLEVLECTLVAGEPRAGHYPEVAWAGASEMRALALAATDKKIIARLGAE
jgi:A/G-specific adenine glycosylase